MMSGMGQKVSPHGARVGVIKNWTIKWYDTRGEKMEENNACAKKLYKRKRFENRFFGK